MRTAVLSVELTAERSAALRALYWVEMSALARAGMSDVQRAVHLAEVMVERTALKSAGSLVVHSVGKSVDKTADC